MIEIIEQGGSTKEYVLAAYFNTATELYLRISQNPSKLLLILFTPIGFYLLGARIAVIIWIVFILVIIMGNFLSNHINYLKSAKSSYNRSVLKYNDQYFQRSLENGFNYPHVKWDNVKIGFYHKSIGCLSLIQKDTGEYHLFFKSRLGKYKFDDFKIHVVKRNVYIK